MGRPERLASAWPAGTIEGAGSAGTCRGRARSRRCAHRPDGRRADRGRVRLEVELTDAQIAAIAERVADIIAAREPAPERWLDTKDAADYLGCHPVTLRKLAAERRIDFQQEGPGCKLYFSTRELDRYRRGEYGHPIPR
jgi:hypothetical protein